MNFAQIIRERRKEKGLTLLQVAQRINVEPSLISKYERGETQPFFDRALLILGALDLSLQIMNNEVGSER